jgi:hemerythrin-like metal-binding protein
MAFLSWHDRFIVGHAEIDAQHQKLFELVNLFDDVIKMGMSEELGRILDDLISATTGHFAFEEALLREIGFPKTLDHARMHAELLKQVQDMRAKMKAGGHVGAKAIVRFLADWLTSHLMREDMDYKPYLHR